MVAGVVVDVGVVVFGAVGLVVVVFWSLGVAGATEVSCGAVLSVGAVVFFFELFVELDFNNPNEVSFLFSYLAPA